MPSSAPQQGSSNQRIAAWPTMLQDSSSNGRMEGSAWPAVPPDAGKTTDGLQVFATISGLYEGICSDDLTRQML